MKNYKSIRDSYITYKNISSSPTDKNTYNKICAFYNKFLIRKVLEGYEVTFPMRMGTLSIIGKKQKIKRDEDGNIISLAPNWRKTVEYWKRNEKAKEQKKLIYCTNEHSNGVRYKYLWSKKNVAVPFKNLYSLRLVRDNKRAVYKAILEGKEFLIMAK